jgi:NAD-dependent deacetylase
MSKSKIVVLTGAGISAESGLRTFRDSDGLWEGYRVEEVATPRAWRADRQMVLDFYNQRRRDVAAAKPNRAHFILAELEADYDVHVITQNIDDLHERAGSTKVLHLHGEIFKMRSDRQMHDDAIAVEIRGDMPDGARAPDGGFWRPHIVWFEEAVPAIEEAARIASTADIFLVVGTSLVVYPAAGLLYYVPPHIPKYVVDKSLPDMSGFNNVRAIELPATEGMHVLKGRLLAGHE